MTEADARAVIREKGMCGHIADGRVCIMDIGHGNDVHEPSAAHDHALAWEAWSECHAEFVGVTSELSKPAFDRWWNNQLRPKHPTLGEAFRAGFYLGYDADHNGGVNALFEAWLRNELKNAKAK